MAEELTDKIVELAKVITDAYRSGGKVILMGNGGKGMGRLFHALSGTRIIFMKIFLLHYVIKCDNIML